VPLDGSKLAERIPPRADLPAGACEVFVEPSRVHDPKSETPVGRRFPTGMTSNIGRAFSAA